MLPYTIGTSHLFFRSNLTFWILCSACTTFNANSNIYIWNIIYEVIRLAKKSITSLHFHLRHIWNIRTWFALWCFVVVTCKSILVICVSVCGNGVVTQLSQSQRINSHDYGYMCNVKSLRIVNINTTKKTFVCLARLTLHDKCYEVFPGEHLSFSPVCQESFGWDIWSPWFGVTKSSLFPCVPDFPWSKHW